MKPKISESYINEIFDTEDEKTSMPDQYHTIYVEAEKWKRREARFQRNRKIKEEMRDVVC